MRWGSAARRGRAGGLAIVAVAALAGCGGGTDRSRGGWTAPNADLSNTRRVGGPIDAASVQRLRVAWRVPLNALYAATPVVVGGVAYTEDLGSNVYAIDASNGRQLWKHVFRWVDVGPNGVNVADGRVYGVLPNSAFALDARTGAMLWKASVGGAVSAGPITYAVNGRQHVAVSAGNALLVYGLR